MSLLESINWDILDNFDPTRRKHIYPQFKRIKAARPAPVLIVHYTANGRWTLCGLSQKSKLHVSENSTEVTCRACKVVHGVA